MQDMPGRGPGGALAATHRAGAEDAAELIARSASAHTRSTAGRSMMRASPRIWDISTGPAGPRRACQGRNVGDVGDPQAIRRVGLETAFDPIRRRPDLHIPARRAGAAAPAHAGHPRGAHHPRDPLAADRDATPASASSA